jgi:molybdate transport system substrate-binding protein
MLAKKDANVAIQPTSELVNLPGIDYVGILPKEIQLIQTYSAAIVRNSPNREAALRFIQYLSRPESAPAIRHGGLEPLYP